MRLTALLLSIFCAHHVFAGNISGSVKDANNQPLPFSSILVKGTASGTTANAKGNYHLTLQPGNYTLVCQHLGHKMQEKKITVTSEALEINFTLEEQEYKLQDVTIKSGGEDPAYAIIKKAIEKREEHLNEVKKFECDVYIKGQLQLRDYPKKFMGEAIDFEDGDTSKQKMIFLSETIAKYSVNGKADTKIEVISTRVSGRSDGFGFSSPQIASFYDNIISLGRGLNPRGFVSPIANNALNFYKYKFEGTFYENGKEISKIKVTPKRTYEPLFTGYINIIENDWRIHSVQLSCLKQQQMQFLDTLKIEQLYVPLKNIWVIKQQVVYPAGKFFTFDFFGSFVQVYDKFNVEPTFQKKFFDNTLLKFYDSSNKKNKAYWDSIRPLPLLENEARDYIKKDSLEQVRKDPRYLDSIDRRNNKVTVSKLLLTGLYFNNEKKKSGFSVSPLITSLLNFNTVEGWVANIELNYSKRYEGRKKLSIAPNIRYGFGNTHLNISTKTDYTFGKKYINNISVEGGKNIFQFDNSNPIGQLDNTLATLQWTRNYMKIYEAKFAKINYTTGLGNGLTLQLQAEYQNRIPLENTTYSVWRKVEGRDFTPNYPTTITSSNITHHQAVSFTTLLNWKPGSKYIEFPDRKINIGSKYPTFSLSYTQGLKGILGSDVNYSKWQFSVNDNLNFKLGGRLSYNILMGGFLKKKQVFIPDMQHFQGNEIVTVDTYLKGFQLMPYYSFSNTDKLYKAAFIEYHLNGLLTNKIPGFKKLNWFLVLGANALYLQDSKKGYYETFVSLENILKIFRVDLVRNFAEDIPTGWGVRFSAGIFGRRQ